MLLEKVKCQNKQSVNYKSEKVWLQTCLEPWTPTTNINITYNFFIRIAHDSLG